MEKLKPCPFCGGKALLRNSPRLLSPYVVCTNCVVSKHGCFDTAEEAIEAWNTRHEITCTYNEGEDYHLICSACGWDRRGALIIPNYCPHCGAYVENHSAPEDYEKYHRFGTKEDGK